MYKLLRENKCLLIIMTMLISFRLTIADWNPIPSGSMRPTLLEGDVVFVNRIAYDLKIPFTNTSILKINNPERGDIVTFDSPANGMKLIKRIEGLPGDIIEMKNKRLFINGIAKGYILKTLPAPIRSLDSIETPTQLVETFENKRHQIQWTPGSLGRNDFGPVRIPQGKYLMLGDNRDNSADSRFIGLVKRELIVGHAVRVLLSVNPDNYFLPRFSRFLSKI